MRLGHALTNLLHKREHDKRRYSVADEGRNDEDETAKDNKDAVETHAFDAAGDRLGNGMEKTGRVDGLAERQASSGENDDGPEEVVEVLLRKDARSKEQHKRDDSHNTHVTEDVLELVADAPQNDGDNSDDADEPLHARELILHRANGYNRGTLAGLECENQQSPDQKDGDDAHRQRDEEPNTPGRFRVHVLKGDKVLRRCDRRCGTTDIGCKSNAQEQCLCHVGIGG